MAESKPLKHLQLGNPGTALIIAPHADDEVIGAYGLIRRLRRAGRRVELIVVTDGAASHPSSRSWPRARLIAARKRETRHAMRRLGVMADDIRFLDLPDGSLGLSPTHGALIRRAVQRTARLGLIVAPDRRDAHPDHQAVAAALSRTILPAVRRLSFVVWGKHVSAKRCLMLGPTRPAKRAAIQRYHTQMGRITDDPAGFAITRLELNAFSRPSELFMEGRPCARSR